MWNNYFSLIDGIKEVSLHHTEEFYEGDVYEYLNNGTHKYPSVILTVQSVDTTDSINTVSATLFCVDRLTDNSDNKLEVQSLCMTKLLKILNSLEENVHNVVSNTFTPFTEKFSDLCGGMYVEFTLQYVGESLCDDMEIKEIELTQNGIYDVIGYDRAIVNVRPVVNLEDITITDNGEYTCGEGFDGFGKVNVDVQPPKIKIAGSLKVTDSCINANGEWENSNLLDVSQVTVMGSCFSNNTQVKYLDLSNWDTSNLNNMAQMFYGASNLVSLNISNWNTSKVTQYTTIFRGCTKLKEIIGIEDIDVSKNAIFSQFFQSCSSLKKLDLTKWDLSSATNCWYMFNASGFQWLDLTGWEVPKVTECSNMFNGCGSLETLVGGRTVEEVIENNLYILKDLSAPTQITTSNKIDRASLRALINGLKDLTGQTAKTLTLSATLKAKLTEEDIAIATNKNWTIA